MPNPWGVLTPGHYAGTDQGVDFSGGGAIPALADVTVTSVRHVSIIEGGSYPLLGFRFDSGPYAGRYGYVMENFRPTVRVGQRVRQGQPLGQAVGAYPYIEIGFAADASGTPAAPLYPNPHGAKPEGALMWSYIQSLEGIVRPPASTPGSSSSTPTAQPVSFLTSPVGTTEALAIRLAFAFAGVALVVVGLYLLSKATSNRVLKLAAEGLAVGKITKAARRPSSSASSPPPARARRRVSVDSGMYERRGGGRRSRPSSSSQSDEIPF